MNATFGYFPPVDDDVPLPDKHSPFSMCGTLGPVLDELNVGQSRFIPTEYIKSVRRYASYHGAKQGKRFVTRTRVQSGVKGIRVWREK